MGKKVCQSSLKTSKNHRQQQDKNQLNSLIKVLRPKVYITDSSSFKRLVQELTGNGNTPAVVSSPPPAIINPKTVDKISIINIEDLGDDRHPSESSIEASSDVSLDSYDELCYYQVSSPRDQELGQAYYSQIYLHDPQAAETTSSEYLLMGQQEDLLAYRDFDSWLLDTEPYPFDNTYNLQIQQEVSIYDYELSGLIL